MNEKAINSKGNLLKMKESFMTGIKNKDFLLFLVILLVKSLAFIILISDDKANGIDINHIFYSMPPFLVWITVQTAFISIALLFKGKAQKWAFWTLDLIFTIIVIGDMWYFRSNSVFLNYHMFKMTSNLENLGSSIISMFRFVDVFFIIDLIVIALKNIKNRKSISTYSRNVCGAVLIFLLSILYLGYAHIKIDKKDMGYNNQYVFRTCWAPNQTMSNLTPIGYHIFDAFEFYKESKPYVFSEEEMEQAKNTLDSLKEKNDDNQYASMLKGKNLILIQWESLETFVINQKVDGQEITPNLNKLLNNSLYFNNFYEQTYNGTSSDAELITNTSVYPVRSGATFFRYPTNEYENSLPNIFERMGYNTLASHPDKGSYWNWLTSLKSIGYSEGIDSTAYDTSDVINLGVSDESYLKQFEKKVVELKEPFMAYTITLTSHSPFDIPKDKQELNLPTYLEGSKLGGYLQSIHYTDKYIGELVENLKNDGVLDNTAIVFYGDHEGVHKFYDDEIASMKGLEPWMEVNNRKVPLIIYNNDIKGEVFSVHGGQIDTLPTLAYLFGAEKEEYESRLTLGRNLLNTKKDYVILSTREILQNNLSEDEQKSVQELIDISDKMISGNYFKKGAGFDE